MQVIEGEREDERGRTNSSGMHTDRHIFKLYTHELEQENITEPLPSFIPCTQSPSYDSPSCHVYTPLPCGRISSSQSPSYTSRLPHMNLPCPLLHLPSTHSPLGGFRLDSGGGAAQRMIGRLTRNSSESGIDSSSCKLVAALHASASNIRTLRIFAS